MKPGVKHPPKTTKNDYSERNNPPKALSMREGSQAVCPSGKDGSRSKSFMETWGYADASPV